MGHHRILVLLVAVMLSAVTLLSQVLAPGTAQTPVELTNEPHHRLKFENEYVRVWETMIPAGEATRWHTHRNDNVVISLSDAKVRVEIVGATPVENQARFGEVGFRKAPYTHRTMSVGTTPFHNMLIEILKSPPGSEQRSDRKEPMDREPDINNERVGVYKVSLAPGESTRIHTHLLSGLSIPITPGLLLIETTSKSKPERLKVAVGDARWRLGAITHSIKNVGKTRFEAVDIELK